MSNWDMIITICLMLAGAIAGAAIMAVTTTDQQRKQHMADITTLLALAKENNGQAKKIRAEVFGMKTALDGRIAALEKLISELTITPEQLAALEAELTGAKETIAEIDSLNPDATEPQA